MNLTSTKCFPYPLMPDQNLDDKNGILPSQWIRTALEAGTISLTSPLSEGQIQPNSLDLRLGKGGYRVQCSFLPGEEGLTRKLERYKWFDFALPPEGVVLERNQIYLFPLQESLNLPPKLSARGNPKSSTGRLDVFTRLVTEHGVTFDDVPAGYRGSLYLEVVPRSFAVRVRQGDTLSQIRFQVGNPHLTHQETLRLLDTEEILLSPNLHILRSSEVPVLNGLILSINLPRKNEPTVGYQARKNAAPVDLRGVGKHSIRQYWDRIYGDSKPIILEPDEFFIFASRELVRLPPNYCAEMVPFDAGSGELRTHYAGFFDSGFGYHPQLASARSAAAVVLEIRNRDVPFLLEDGQPLFRLELMHCTESPDFLYGQGIGSNYQSQRLRLGKQFTATVDGENEDELRGQTRLGL